MFKRFLLLVLAIPSFLGFSTSIVACQWDLNPDVLLITSYEHAQQQTTEDRLIYQKLTSIYGRRAITAVFSHQDDNMYANILQNLIVQFRLKKVFILDPSFNDYLPQFSFGLTINTNLIRVLHQFTNVDFYFFNNQISNTVKLTNNIYEFRFDTPNQEQENPPLSYGGLLAEHFHQQLVDDGGQIDTTRYNFDVDDQANWIVRIGVINNIGNSYQQRITNDFVTALEDNIPPNTKYEYYQVNLDIPDSYTSDNIRVVEAAANRLYQTNYVNFIFSSNSWYNNAIAHAIVTTSSLPKYTKTMKFIASSVVDQDAYKTDNKNYMMFSYNWDLTILDFIDGTIPEGYQVVQGAPESFHAYGLNSDLEFVDGL